MTTYTFHKTVCLLCLLLAGSLLLTSCEDDKKPDSLMPILSVEEAKEVTRTSALLSGTVKTTGTELVTVLQFRYGLSADMTETVECDPSLPAPSAVLTELLPGTTYHYCLEAGNGHSIVQSVPLQFTTQPNQVPAIANFHMLGQGPVSITMQYELADDGGEPVTGAGFYYRAEDGEEMRQTATLKGSSVYYARISGLRTETAYTVQAYAVNTIGETRSETFSFRTGQAVITTQPGTLSEIMGNDEKYHHTSLRIAGPLDGSDIRFIRDMAGRGVNDEETPGSMTFLDLTDAVIHSGGTSYDGMRYTEDNVIGYGMFAHCLYLKELILPDTAEKIEENAFKGCQTLATLLIPATVTHVVPSDGCPQLSSLEVAEGNVTLHSIDGVLYDNAGDRLLWFPEGKTESPSWPATLKSIGKYAFRNCRLKEVVLPSSVKEIEQGAFYASQIETMVLPEQLEMITAGLFQECRKLTSVTLGSQTNYLSDYCFDGCPLQHLYVKTVDFPPMCFENTFPEQLFDTCVLHVPSGCRTMYRNSTYWGKFKKIVEETTLP